MQFTYIVCFTLIILFAIWQWKVMAKYSFKYDNLKIDTVNKNIVLNNEVIKFSDIDYIDVKELEQPSLIEKIFTKSLYNYMADIIFHLKNGTTQKCACNYKGILYKNLKQLQNHVNIKINQDIKGVEHFKPYPNYLIILLIVILSILLIKFNITVSNFVR